jgi:hypothetical protein
VIDSSLHILKSRLGADDRARKHVGRIDEQLALANQIVSDLLDMIRDRPLERARIRPAALVERALSSIKAPPEVRILLKGFDARPEIEADASKLRQVIVNSSTTRCMPSARRARSGCAAKRKTGTWCSPSRTTARVSTRASARPSSSRSSRPRPRALGSDCRWSGASSSVTEAPSATSRPPAAAPASSCACRSQEGGAHA